MKVGRRLSLPESKRYFKPDSRFVMPDCRLGLEFEWEGTKDVARNRELPPTEWSHYWTWHEEGSLRYQGSELVFTEPLFGQDAYDAIKGLCSLARRQEWQSTARTGIHVHVDVRDLEVPQLVGMCILYALYEKAIYRFVGDDREDNHFCLPWYKADGSILQAAQVIKAAQSPVDERKQREGVEELVIASDAYQRYAGLNLQSLSRFGSVEFRHLKTTYALERIINWINILLSLKAATYKVPTSDGAIVQLIEGMGATAFGRDFFGKTFGLLEYPELDEDVRKFGIPCADVLVREGLTVNLAWDMLELPRGENKGFSKFLKENKPIKKDQVVEREVLVGGQNDLMYYDDVGVPQPILPPPVLRRNQEGFRNAVNHLRANLPPRIGEQIQRAGGVQPARLRDIHDIANDVFVVPNNRR